MSRVKQTTNSSKPSINIMVFFLPNEFRAPGDQEIYSDFDESEYEELAAKLVLTF